MTKERRHSNGIGLRLKMKSLGLLGAWILAVSLTPASAQAMSKDVRTVLVGGMYGAVGGTALGLIAFPMTKEPRTILMGTSIGMYLGMAVGVYHAMNRDDGGNPLRLDYRRSEAPSGEPEHVAIAEYDLLRF